ncbi:MAG: hypothetical protein IPI65_22155 [Bacteroidetes bacterium]|nr:hypothetical protein [Bacteroidota bacterium]
MIKLICIAAITILISGCKKISCPEKQSILGYWDFATVNSDPSNLLYGVCYKENSKAFNFINNYDNSTRVINDLVIDGEPISCSEILFSYQVDCVGNKLFLQSQEYTIIHISNDSIVYQSPKSGLKFKLIPSKNNFIDDWDNFLDCQKY